MEETEVRPPLTRSGRNGGTSPFNEKWKKRRYVPLYYGFSSPTGYFTGLCWPTEGEGKLQATNKKAVEGFLTAIEEGDVRLMSYDKTLLVASADLAALLGCRENLLNEVYQVKPGEKHRFPISLDSSIQDVGILLFGEKLTHRLYRPDGTVVPLEVVDGALRSRDPETLEDPFAPAGEKV